MSKKQLAQIEKDELAQIDLELFLKKAEKALESGRRLSSLKDIAHNYVEVLQDNSRMKTQVSIMKQIKCKIMRKIQLLKQASEEKKLKKATVVNITRVITTTALPTTKVTIQKSA